MSIQISKEALSFLKKLKKNNNRPWFDERKPEFKALEKQVKLFYGEVEQLLNQHDDIQKTKAYRIYRDIRFSKDKTPYKTHYGANFQRRKPKLCGGYYLRIAPNNQSALGIGFWKPGKRDLERMRKEWLIDADEFRTIITAKAFKETWGEMGGETLKTAPRGYDRTHPDIDLVNYKQWVFRHYFTDREVLGEDFAQKVDKCYQTARPFFDYMSAVLTTDLNGVSLIDE